MRFSLREPFRTYRYTTLAVLLGIVALSTAVAYEVKVFEALAASVAAFSAWHAGDLLLLIIPLSLGFALDMRRRTRMLQQQNEQHRNQFAVLRATMVAVNDIMLDFLHHLQAFRHEIDAHPGLPAESLRDLDDQIRNTSTKLRHLGDIDIQQSPEPALGTGRGDGASPGQAPVNRAQADMVTQSCGPR